MPQPQKWPNQSCSIGSEPTIAGLYDLQGTIGKGHFAVVKLASHVFTGEKVAVKVINKTKLDPVSKEHLFQEVMCMKLVQHPNVVRLYEVIDTSYHLYLVLELGDGGDLYDYIVKHEGGIPEPEAQLIFRQIVTGISYCHNLHVVHRDLKPENVVFFEKLGLVKLTDFGFSNKFIPGKHLETSCGSLAYSAPEILLGDSYDPPLVDIWSLGVILFMVVVGTLPFSEGTDSETLSKIMDCSYAIPARLSKPCCQLISRLLVRDPHKRANLEEILKDKWLCHNIDQDLMNDISVPLISREMISDDDHNSIVAMMQEGNLATKDEIQAAIASNEYSYITATYYLLAERKLKRQYFERNRQAYLLQSELLTRRTSLDSTSQTPAAVVCQSAVRVLEQSVTSAPEEKLRRFSMILEDEEDEDDELAAITNLSSVRYEIEAAFKLSTLSEMTGTTAPTTSRCCSRSSGGQTTDFSDGADSDASVSQSICRPNGSKHRRNRKSLISVKSSPQLLKNISEEESHTAYATSDYSLSTSVAAVYRRDPSSKGNRASGSRSRPVTFTNSSPNFQSKVHRHSDTYTTLPSRSSSDNSDNDTESNSARQSNRRRSRQFDFDFGNPEMCSTSFRFHSRGRLRNDSENSSDTDSSHHLFPSALRSTPVSVIGSAAGDTSAVAISSSQKYAVSTGSNIGTSALTSCVREKFTPICEEDEENKHHNHTTPDSLVKDEKSDIESVVLSGLVNNSDNRPRSESVDGPTRSIGHYKASNLSLSSTPNQSNFSLSSMAGSLRGSKAMIDMIKGTLDISNSTKKPVNQTERSSLRSLPVRESCLEDHASTSPTRFGSNNNSINVSVNKNAEVSVKPKINFSCCGIS